MPTPEEPTLKDWSSSDKTLSEGKARRVSAGSVNGASRAAVRHRHAVAWAKPEKRRLQVNQFQQFVTPDDGRKFTELYNVQHLQSAQLDRVSRVCISTIQRLYSMLRWLIFWVRNTDAIRREQRDDPPLREVMA
jgi:hypothetical protein